MSKATFDTCKFFKIYVVFWMEGENVIYRLKYSVTGAERAGTEDREFEANSEQEAVSLVPKICKQEADRINKNIKNRFWRFSIKPLKLVRVIQREVVSCEIPFVL
jgi:hypothetical protein